VIVNLNTTVVGRRRPFPVASLAEAPRARRLADAEVGRRDFYAGGTWRTAPVYARERLPVDLALAGPAVIQQLDATTVVEPGATARLDSIGNLRIAVGGAA
jgi:N-methylhydantoinase A